MIAIPQKELRNRSGELLLIANKEYPLEVRDNDFVYIKYETGSDQMVGQIINGEFVKTYVYDMIIGIEQLTF